MGILIDQIIRQHSPHLQHVDCDLPAHHQYHPRMLSRHTDALIGWCMSVSRLSGLAETNKQDYTKSDPEWRQRARDRILFVWLVRNPIRQHYVERFWAQLQSSIRRPLVATVHRILDIYPCKKPEMGWCTSHEHDWYMTLFFLFHWPQRCCHLSKFWFTWFQFPPSHLEFFVNPTVCFECRMR